MNKLMFKTIIKNKTAFRIEEIANKLLHVSKRVSNMDLLTQEEKKVLLNNKIYDNIHKNSRAFVIANGPSLKNQNLSLLKNEVTFAVNGFWKHPVVKVWQPTYYGILDAEYFKNKSNIYEFWNNIDSKVQDSTLFLPLFRGYENNMNYNFTKRKNCYYIASTGPEYPSVDITKVIQGFESVSALVLSIAVYMGCNPIYLLGYDHDYLSHRGIDHHFYSGSALRGHLNENTPISALNSYESDMESMLRLWKNYKNIQSVAKQKGIQIYNASENSYLDVFQNIDYQNIF